MICQLYLTLFIFIVERTYFSEYHTKSVSTNYKVGTQGTD